MESGRYATEEAVIPPIGTYDSANPVEVMKAVDLAMRQYFDTHDWLVMRNRLFRGLRR